jgi:hypothetical protein
MDTWRPKGPSPKENQPWPHLHLMMMMMMIIIHPSIHPFIAEAR